MKAILVSFIYEDHSCVYTSLTLLLAKCLNKSEQSISSNNYYPACNGVKVHTLTTEYELIQTV